MLITSSTPSFSDFDPSPIAWQDRAIDDILCQYDYSLGTHEVLFSGAAGSAKSMVLVHIPILICLRYPGARWLFARRAMPDLRDTILKKALEHLQGSLIEGVHYTVRHSPMPEITFANGSEIICRSWADGNYLKLRSLELCGASVEELTENDAEDAQAYHEIMLRVGRLNHVPMNLVMSATNPDDPGHWAYKHFQLELDEETRDSAAAQARMPTRHVYYSITSDNVFLPAFYHQQMKEKLDPKMYERMGKGRWIEIAKEKVYYAYNRGVNYRDVDYVVDEWHPVHISWDFNIGVGKPLSAVFFQWIAGEMHIFAEVVVEGMRTASSCDEMAARGLLDYQTHYFLHGDATGRARSTNAIHSNYEIIEQFFANYRTKPTDHSGSRHVNFDLMVPTSNPPIAERHTAVNGHCMNAYGRPRLFVYRGAPTADEGLRLTALKKGATVLEDDSKAYQHITTAIGYGLCSVSDMQVSKPQGTVRL